MSIVTGQQNDGTYSGSAINNGVNGSVISSSADDRIEITRQQELVYPRQTQTTVVDNHPAPNIQRSKSYNIEQETTNIVQSRRSMGVSRQDTAELQSQIAFVVQQVANGRHPDASGNPLQSKPSASIPSNPVTSPNRPMCTDIHSASASYGEPVLDNGSIAIGSNITTQLRPQIDDPNNANCVIQTEIPPSIVRVSSSNGIHTISTPNVTVLQQQQILHDIDRNVLGVVQSRDSGSVVKPPLSRHPSNERYNLPADNSLRPTPNQQDVSNMQTQLNFALNDVSIPNPNSTNGIPQVTSSQPHVSHPSPNFNPVSPIPAKSSVLNSIPTQQSPLPVVHQNSVVHQQQLQQQQQQPILTHDSMSATMLTNGAGAVTNFSEPQRRKSRFVLLGQNGGSSVAAPATHISEEVLHQRQHQQQNEQPQQSNHISQQSYESKMSVPQDLPVSVNAQRGLHTMDQANGEQAVFVAERSSQQIPMSQYAFVTGLPQQTHFQQNQPQTPALYQVMTTQTLDQNGLALQSVPGGQHPAGSLCRAVSVGVVDQSTQFLVLQPVNSRHFRPKSEGRLDTNDSYHDKRETIAQGAENHSYFYPAKVLNQIVQGPVTVPRPMSSEYSYGVNLEGTQSHDPSNTLANQQMMNSSYPTTANSIPTELVHYGQAATVPNAQSVTSNASVATEVDGGNVTMTKGRFRFLESGIVPGPNFSTSQELIGEQYLNDETAMASSAPFGIVNTNPITTGISQHNSSNSVVKRGRFVVTSVSETSQAYSNSIAPTIQATGLMPNSTSVSVPTQVSAITSNTVSPIVIDQQGSSLSASASEDTDSKAQLNNTVQSDTQSISRPLPTQDRMTSSAETSLSDEANSVVKTVQTAKVQDEGSTRPKADRLPPHEENLASQAVHPSDHRSNDALGSRVNVTPTYTRAARNPLEGPNVGVGKIMHNLSMMQSEMNDLDRYHRNLQTENRCLKEKNKELEAKARDWERKFYSEKLAREKNEQKLKELETKVRSNKGKSSTVQQAKEDSVLSVSSSERKVTGSRSFEGERDPTEEFPQGESEKGSSTTKETKSEVQEMAKGSAVQGPEGNGNNPSTTSDSSQLSPSRDLPTKSPMLQKPPILPYQKKAGPRSNGNGASQGNPQRKNAEVRNQPTMMAIIQNVAGDSTVVSNQSSPTTSVQLVNDGFSVHEHTSAPRPPGVNINYRVEHIPSTTHDFDPLSHSSTNDNRSVETYVDSAGPPAESLPSSLPGFIVTPVHGQNPDILSFPLDSWVHATTYAAEGLSEMHDQRQAMYLIHQPLEMQSVDSSHLFGDSNHIPLMTYSLQPNGHSHQPSISDFNSSKDHSRNPSAGQIPHVNQSWTSSPLHQGTYTPPQTDILSSDNLTIPLTDYMSLEHAQSERELLLPSNFAPVQGEVMSAWPDPFDPNTQRKANTEDF